MVVREVREDLLRGGALLVWFVGGGGGGEGEGVIP